MITHDHRIIFTHIPKCAGRSICDIFNQRFDHYTSHYYATEFNRFWESYRKFTIVRNPFDRLVSLYEYIKNHRRHINERIAVSPVMPSFSQWVIMNIANYQGPFHMDSAEGARGTDGDLGSSFWFSSQSRRISAGKHKALYMQDIFRLEDGMNHVEDYLAKHTGIKVTMPHSNKSEYADYRIYYSNDKVIEAVANFHPVHEDCEIFGYSFDK